MLQQSEEHLESKCWFKTQLPCYAGKSSFFFLCDFYNSFILTNKDSCVINTSIKKCKRLSSKSFKNARTVAVSCVQFVVFNKIMNMSAVNFDK